MGGRGSSFGKAGKGVNMNDYGSVKKEIDRLGGRMEKLIRTTDENGITTSAARREYYKVQGRRTELRNHLRTLSNPDRVSGGSRKTFVNGYGEATRREITSTTYERAQKRTDRDVAAFVGSRR